jgi:hypothetical protein
MTRKRIVPLLLAAVTAAVVLGGAAAGLGPAPAAAQEATPTPVTTGNIPLVMISPALCFPLVITRFTDQTTGATHANNCAFLDSKQPTAGGSTQGADALKDLESVIGDNDGVLEPSDFASIDLDGNQVHNQDDLSGTGTSLYDGNLFVLAFVSSTGPVRFRTNRGLMIPAGLLNPSQDLTVAPADTAGTTYVCDSQAGTQSGPLVEDADCNPGGGTGADGVVVGRVRAHWGATTAPIGPGTVTVNQGQSDEATIAFRVVGEPRTLSFTTLETKIQDGAGGTGQCPLPGDAAGFLGANGTAEKSIVLGIARDIEGNAVTGAVINWSTDFPNRAKMAAPLTPTLDLGSFGFGAPNIICGATETGKVTVTGAISKDLLIATNFDPNAEEDTNTVSFDVVGVPASMTLAANPPSLPCDGTATTSVTAAVVDADGTPAVAGTQVHFDVQVLGTANPIDAKTDDKGVATSTISPLAPGASGVPVNVFTGNVASSILVQCTTGAPGGGPPPPAGGGAGGAGGGPTGVITGPNTGYGPAGGQSLRWAYLLGISGLGLLAGSAMVLAGARANRK